MIATPQSKPQTRTTFLTLPHELRQKILRESHESWIAVISRYKWLPDDRYIAIDLVDGHEPAPDLIDKQPSDNTRYKLEKVKTINWTQVLRCVCSEIHGDIEYMKKKWLENADRALAQCKGMWTSLLDMLEHGKVERKRSRLSRRMLA